MILVFGGTTEGRLAAEVCEAAGKTYYYSTRGSGQDVPLVHGQRLTGGMTAAEIRHFVQERGVRCIVDAAHPFAEELHRAVAEAGVPVVRLQRELGEPTEGVTYCCDVEEALERLLAEPAERLLALTGVKSIEKLAPYWRQHTTFFRILNRPESLRRASEAGFPAEQLLYYDEELSLPTTDEEAELMQRIGCDVVLTKRSGANGGLEAKTEAAKRLGLRCLVIEPPKLPEAWTYVTGKHGLRREIERKVPEFFELKTGLTTGTCAQAATKAALVSLLSGAEVEAVTVLMPCGERVSVEVEPEGSGAASVVKCWSDDPDVTRGCRVRAEVAFLERGAKGVRFERGRGVGVATLEGLGIPVGEAAVSVAVRKAIEAEVRGMTERGVRVRLSIENGEVLARQTFNGRVGVEGGLSIIGTSGVVIPFSNEAFVESIGREMEVAAANYRSESGARTEGERRGIGLASGKMGEEMLLREEPDLWVIHYGNFVGAALRKAYEVGFRRVVLGIMIGKAVKLAAGNLDTHSHKVSMDKDFLVRVAESVGVGDALQRVEGIRMARELWGCMPPEFFERLRELCQQHCREVFPTGEIVIRMLCDREM